MNKFLLLKSTKNLPSILAFLFVIPMLSVVSCQEKSSKSQELHEHANQAEKLGFPAGKKVIILHADDAGMCEEANIATKKYFENGEIQSAAIMAPCPNADEFIEWAKTHTDVDVGMHLTHTSEWKTYRWGPVSNPADVPGLVDPEGKLWHEVPDVVQHASAAEVEKEIRAQIDKAISMGYQPNHIDTHMGTLYGHPEYAKAFLKVAMEYGIPANAINLSDSLVAAHFKKSGYPINDEMIAEMEKYTLPKLDFFTSVPHGDTYEEMRENFFNLVKTLPAGLTEIIFHPSVESDNLKSITNSWQQRVWEAELFSDPVVKKFFKDENIQFTNWIDIMKRFKENK